MARESREVDMALMATGKLQPHYCEPGTWALRAVQAFLFQVAVAEKNWPVMDVARMLCRTGQLIGVFVDGICVAGTQIIYQRPFPAEEPPFNHHIPRDRRKLCEITLIAVSMAHRRKVSDGGLAALDAIIKGCYWTHRHHRGTHLLSVCEDWTFQLLSDAYIKTVAKKISEGFHYWCGIDSCPSPECKLTFVCEFDLNLSALRWQAERPDFWAYINS